jgi:hypothetical protein
MGLFVHIVVVVVDEEEFAHDLNELIELYKLFLEVLLVVMLLNDDMFERDVLLIKNR